MPGHRRALVDGAAVAMLRAPGLPSVRVEQGESSRIPQRQRRGPAMGRRSRLAMPARSASEPPRFNGESLPPLGTQPSMEEITVDTEVRVAAGRESRLGKARKEMERLSQSTDTALIMQCLRKHANGSWELKPVWLGLQAQLRRVTGLTDWSAPAREPDPEPEQAPQPTLDLAEVLRRADDTLVQAAKSRYILSGPSTEDESNSSPLAHNSDHPKTQKGKKPERVSKRTPSPQPARHNTPSPARQQQPTVTPPSSATPARRQSDQRGSAPRSSFRQRQAAAEDKFRRRKEQAALAKVKREEESDEAPQVAWRRGLRSDAAREAGKDSSWDTSEDKDTPGFDSPPAEMVDQPRARSRTRRASSPASSPTRGANSRSRTRRKSSPVGRGRDSPRAAADAVLTARQRVKMKGSPTASELKERLRAAEALIADLRAVPEPRQR